MHEREPDDEDELPPVFMARSSVVDDVGFRGAWMEAAEYIADMEERIALRLRRPTFDSTSLRDGDDHADPGFLYIGDRDSLAFIAEMAAGIIKHGQAFAFWVREMGGKPEALDDFEKVFLGQWESAEEFAQHVLDDRRAAEDSERSGSETSPEDMPADAKSWAQDLQRRDEIRVVLSPLGGVWIFRGW